VNETKEKIENFVDEAIKNNDYELLDILWTFSYSTQETSKSGYWRDDNTFKKMLPTTVCKRNLTKKYGWGSSQIKEKMKVFVDFLNTMPDFLSGETFNEDNKLLREILVNKSSKILVQNIECKIQDLSDLDKKILSFVLNYIPIRIQDSIKEAEERKQQNPYFKDKYYSFPDFSIKRNPENRETDKIDYFKINPEEWTYIFNSLFKEELQEKEKVKLTPHRRGAAAIFFPEPQKEYSFSQFGDELVKVGIGYWVLYVPTNTTPEICFIIPNFIYEDIKTYKEHLPIVENSIEKINEIEKERETKKVEKWSLEDFEERDAVREVWEIEIEKGIISNPEILEEELELIGKQYPTSVGYIDILYKDKNENFVVIEVKRGTGSYNVVGQIQKYMAWVNENLAKDKQVRGIIVVKECDKGLEYAIEGSKFPIEIKIFGKNPPTEENIRYCDRCGKPNKKSAKYCIKCGQKFWM